MWHLGAAIVPVILFLMLFILHESHFASWMVKPTLHISFHPQQTQRHFPASLLFPTFLNFLISISHSIPSFLFLHFHFLHSWFCHAHYQIHFHPERFKTALVFYMYVRNDFPPETIVLTLSPTYSRRQ